jgi:peroxiredoxin family protein
MMHLAKGVPRREPLRATRDAKDPGVHLVPCQMTMDLFGLKREDLIDGLDEPAGATKALADAQGGITPFIRDVVR